MRFAHASPDGRRVVYEALGHLWIKDIAQRRAAAPADQLRRPRGLSRLVARRPADRLRHLGRRQGAARSRSSARPAAPADRHARAGLLPRARLLARREDDRLPQGIGRLPRRRRCGAASPASTSCRSATGAKPKRVAKTGAFPHSARTATASSSSISDDDNQLFKSVDVDRRRPITHLKATNAAEFALSPDEQFIGWTERYQAYVMPFVRTGKDDRHRADAKALPLTQGQRRRRRLSPLVGRRQHALLDAGPATSSRAASISPPSTAPRPAHAAAGRAPRLRRAPRRIRPARSR